MILHHNHCKKLANPTAADQEWEPCMFSLQQVKEIEQAWQYAAVVLSHFRMSQDVFGNSADLSSLLDGDNSSEEEEEEEEALLTLSPTKRLSTPQGYEDLNHVVQEAVRRDVRALVWASERLRNQGDLWLPVIRRDARLVRYLSNHCRQDVDFCRQAVVVNPEAIYYIARPCCYNVRILRAAWQGDQADAEQYCYYHHDDARSSVSQPLFPETFPGERTGSLLRYAVVVLGLDVRQSRRVARQCDSLEDFDRWDNTNDLHIIQDVAQRHPERFTQNLVSTSRAVMDTVGRSPTTAVVNKATALRTLRRTGVIGNYTRGASRGRHVRKLSETQ